MTTSKQHTAAFALMFVLLAGEVFAAGTPAGTIIQSRSRVTFSTRSGAVIDTVYSAALTITVAQKGSFNISPPSNSVTTASDSTSADYPVVITNSGNGTDAARLSVASSRGWTARIFRDLNSDGILQSSEAAAGAITQSPSLIADAQFAAVVRISVPKDVTLNGAKDSATVVVKSLFDSLRTVSGVYVTTVQTAGIDPLNPGVTINNPTPGAGQNVTYTYVLTNSGSVAAANLVIQHTPNGAVTLVGGTTTIGTFSGSSTPFSWNIGTLAAGQSVTITLTVQINNGISAGTVIPASFGINYSVGNNAYYTVSNTVLLTVSGTPEYGVDIVCTSSALVKEPADTAWYRYSVRNVGSFKDVIELSHTSTRGFAWKFFRDGNNNALPDAGDPELTNTNGAFGADVDSVAIGDSVRIFARVIVPRSFAVGIRDTLAVIASSSGNGQKKDTATVVTTVNEPLVEMTKSVFPVGSQPAGGVVTYTIGFVNIGSVPVTNFSVIDTAPLSTSYVVNSIKVNGIAVADNHPSVSIQNISGNRTMLTVSIGTLAANSSGTVEFSVKIQ